MIDHTSHFMIPAPQRWVNVVAVKRERSLLRIALPGVVRVLRLQEGVNVGHARRRDLVNEEPRHVHLPQPSRQHCERPAQVDAHLVDEQLEELLDGLVELDGDVHVLPRVEALGEQLGVVARAIRGVADGAGRLGSFGMRIWYPIAEKVAALSDLPTEGNLTEVTGYNDHSSSSLFDS